MGQLPEEAVVAAAKAIFEHSIIAGSDREKVRIWLAEAGDYYEIARVALTAALPFLRIPQAGDSAS